MNLSTLFEFCSAQRKNMEFRLTSRSVPVSIVAARRPKNNQKKTEPADFKEISRFSILDDILGLAAQDNVNWNIYKTVNKVPHRFPVQAKGFALSTPTIL